MFKLNRARRQPARHPRRLLATRFDILEPRRLMDATYHNLSGGNFSQDWTDTAQISVNDNWSTVPSIVGFLSGLGTASGTNPSTVTGTSTAVDVNANQTNPNTFTSGGVTEYELANPAVGLAGSNSAGSPYIQLHINSTGVDKVDVKYNVRDLDSSGDNATQQVALQYRTNTTDAWTDLPAFFIADATTAGSATQITPISATLPDDAGNKANLQVRIITGNAAGNDEPVGIDDIVVSPTPIVTPPGAFQLDSRGLRIDENAGIAVVTVTRQGGTGGAVTVDYTTSDVTATSGSDFTTTSGTLQFADGQSTADIQIPLTNDNADEVAETLTVTISNPTGGATLNPTTSNTVTIVDADGQALSAGPLTQDWSNLDLITINDNWDNVPNIIGYLTDAERDAGVVDVIANQANPSGQSQGGVGEFDGIADPTVALQGSNAAASPQLVLDIDTRGVSAVDVTFDAVDIDAASDDAIQSISVGYRIGNVGDFIEIAFLEDATTGPSLAELITRVTAALPAEALGQELVQVRISTTNAAGNDEWVGIDNIRVGAPTVTGVEPTLASSVFAFETAQSMTLTFDQDVEASLTASDLTVRNLMTGLFVDSSAFTLSQSTSGGVTAATVAFSTVLANGNYEVRVLANSISSAGNPVNSSDLVASFYVLAGDANRDRVVNFSDLVILAQNYNSTARTFSQGNFNYDVSGNVNFADLVLLAQGYNQTLAAPALPLLAGASRTLAGPKNAKALNLASDDQLLR